MKLNNTKAALTAKKHIKEDINLAKSNKRERFNISLNDIFSPTQQKLNMDLGMR